MDALRSRLRRESPSNTFPQAVSAATARFRNSLICLSDSLALITRHSLSGHLLPAFLAVLDCDAPDSLAAIELVAHSAISCQRIDTRMR